MPQSLELSGYATIDDVDKVPLATPQGKQAYSQFISAREPRAFAISGDRSHFAWNAGIANAAVMALMRCNEHFGQTCSLYAVNDRVVWTKR
jgi:hypothetical protein